jgi:hypothetical protein
METIDFWKSKLSSEIKDNNSFYFHILADMALRLLSARTSESCVERVFSYLKRIHTADSVMMSQETLFYRLINCLYGKIHDDKSWEAF